MQSQFAPEFDTPRARALPAIRNQLAYQAASQDRRFMHWRPSSVSPNAILGLLSTIRDRSRQATRNDGNAKAISDELVANIIGTGITPLSQAKDSEFRKLLQALWTIWVDQSDADGLLDFYGQQAQLTRSWTDAGEVFARLRDRTSTDGLVVPLQVQLLEPEQCPYTHNGTAANGNRIRAGVEFNAIGRRVAYYFYPSRPEVDDYDLSSLLRIPAESVIHVFDPLRPGQIRGVPKLTQALIKLLSLDKLSDAILVRQELANLFVAFLTRDAALGDTSDEIDPLNPITGRPRGTGAPAMMTLEPGIFQELEPGENVEFSTPPDVGTTYEMFMRQQLRAACVSGGVPYELVSGDMSTLNDRTVRVILNQFKRRVAMAQHQIIAYQFCRRVWKAWLDRVFVSGVLPIPPEYIANPEPWLSVRWMPQRWAYIHPVQDVEADEKAIRAGFTTRAAVASENGEDVEQIDQEQAADNTRADKLGLKYTSDGRNPTTAKAAPAAEPEPAEPEPAPARRS